MVDIFVSYTEEDCLDVVCTPMVCNPKQSHNNATWTCPNERLNPLDPS